MAELDGVVQAAVLRPGDKLVLRLHHDQMTPENLDFVRVALGERLPGVEVVFLAVEDMAVFRSDGADNG